MIAQLNSSYVRTRPQKVLPRLLSYALFEGRPLTTRGQWINPLVFALFALEERLPQLKEVRKPVFVVGTGRSGSTILGMLLSMHREVGFLNEPKALWHAVYPYSDVFGQHSKGPALYRLEARDATEEVRRRAHRLYGAYLLASGERRVVDKHPELIFRVPFVRAIFPDARFVFLLRDGYDTCRSIESWSQRNGTRHNGEVHDWWGASNRKWRLMLEQLLPEDEALAGSIEEIARLDKHRDMAAVEWTVTMREGLRQMERYPGSFYMLRHESLVENPRGELDRLLEFCGLPPDEVFLEFAQRQLSPGKASEPFEVHPAIRSPFEDTMKALGYRVG